MNKNLATLLAAVALALFGCNYQADSLNVTTSTTVAANEDTQPIAPPPVEHHDGDDPGAQTADLPASADTYVRKGAANTNEGASPILRLQAAGDNRALVRFDQNAIAALLGGGTLVSAVLELEIEEAKNNWGKNGREIGAHRLLSDWAEGNGKNAELKAKDSYRGDGVGATWNCAQDQNINNQKSDCTEEDDWEMRLKNQPSPGSGGGSKGGSKGGKPPAGPAPFAAPWVEAASESQFINKKQEGVVAFDVTADVAAFLDGEPNFGWVIRKGEENKPGYVSFHSRETGAAGPRLVLTWLSAEEPPVEEPADNGQCLADCAEAQTQGLSECAANFNPDGCSGREEALCREETQAALDECNTGVNSAHSQCTATCQ